MVFSRKNILSCLLILAIVAISIPGIALAENAAVERKEAAATGQAKIAGSGSCLDLGGLHIKQCFANVMNVILGFAAFILGISAFLLNFVINYTIVDLGKNLGSITAINTTWATIRDLINLSFIFILLYASIRTVLGLESPGKIIKNIVLAAIFINFSMFFARVMIDASNSVTLFFYDRLTDNKSTTSMVVGLNDPKANSLVNAYITPLRLQSVYGIADPIRNKDSEKSAVDTSTIFTVGLLGSIMLFLVAFVFFTITFMFVIRYAALILLLIFSPLGFVSKDLPMMGDYNEQWWTTLKSQLLFPPIFMLLTWITLNVISGIKPAVDGNLRDALSTAGGNPPTDGGIALLLNFLVIMTLIVMSLLVSIETASKGSQALGGFYRKASKWAGATMFGTAAFAGRKTIGRVGALASQSEGLKNFAANSRVGRLALMGADYAQKGSFDVRGSAFGKNFAATTGLEAGPAGGEGGIEKQDKKRREKIEARAKLLETSRVKKDEIKAQLGEIAEEKKPIEDEIEKIEKKFKEAGESSPEFKRANTENANLVVSLDKLDKDIKIKNQELLAASSNPTKQAAIVAQLDQMANKKTELEEQQRKVQQVMAGSVGEETVKNFNELQKQKKAIEERTGEKAIKEEDKKIKQTEKDRKRAYAKSLKETPSTVETQSVASAVRGAGSAIGGIAERGISFEERLARGEVAARKGGTVVNGWVNKLSSVANLGVEGVAMRTLVAPIATPLMIMVDRSIKKRESALESETDENERDRLSAEIADIKKTKEVVGTFGLSTAVRAASAKVRADVLGKSKAQSVYDMVKEDIKKDEPAPPVPTPPTEPEKPTK